MTTVTQTIADENLLLRQRIAELEQERDEARTAQAHAESLLEARNNEPRTVRLLQAEEQLRMAQFALDHAADGIHWLNAAGFHLYVNDEACNQLGYTREELLTRGIGDIAPNMSPERWSEYWNFFQQQRSLTFESVHCRKDGTTFPVEITVSFLEFNDKAYVCAFTRDITERKHLAEQLRQNEQWFRHLMMTLFDGLIIHEKGVIVEANPAACEMFGYEQEEMVGMQTLELAAPEYRDMAQHYISTGYDRPYEALLVKKDGSIFPAEVIGKVVEYQGCMVRMTTARDLSERKQAEKERELLQQQIIDAQQEALRELSSPLIPLSDRVVMMPLIGAIDSWRAQQIMSTLLEGVAHYHAERAILDMTGVSVVDNQVANALVQAAQAVHLLGAQVILTGINPAMSQALVHLGADLSNIVAHNSLQTGIAYALRRCPKDRKGNQP